MILESTDLNTLISALIAFILAIIAIFNKQRTDIAKTNVMQSAIQVDQPIPMPTGGVGFEAIRDGSKILNGLDGWYARINPSPQAATLPDDKCWQAVSAKGIFWGGDKETVLYLITNADAAGWRARNG